MTWVLLPVAMGVTVFLLHRQLTLRRRPCGRLRYLRDRELSAMGLCAAWQLGPTRI